jgi:cell wall-associated NlpC family hydrolase
MMNVRFLGFLVLSLALGIAACGTSSSGVARSPEQARTAEKVVKLAHEQTGAKYRFGGRSPDTGFDCSGLVSYVFERAAGMRLTGSAADIARKGRVVPSSGMQPGDLVFFNIQGTPYSHVGIYAGNGRFIHAPSSKGKARVRTDSLNEGYFASRFSEARTYFY